MPLAGFSIKWKILLLVTIGPVVIGGILAWQHENLPVKKK